MRMTGSLDRMMSGKAALSWIYGEHRRTPIEEMDSQLNSAKVPSDQFGTVLSRRDQVGNDCGNLWQASRAAAKAIFPVAEQTHSCAMKCDPGTSPDTLKAQKLCKYGLRLGMFALTF